MTFGFDTGGRAPATNAHLPAVSTVGPMIGYLRGRVLTPTLVLTGADVGYVVHTAAPLVVDEQVELFIHTVVREDAITCYGFPTLAEQELFVILTRLTGVGPAVALALLRDIGPGPLVTALLAEDAAALVKAAGVGPKKARDITVMAKGKVPAAMALLFGAQDVTPQPGPHEDIITTLVGMGFTERAAAEAVGAAIIDSGVGLDHQDDGWLLRRALSTLRSAA